MKALFRSNYTTGSSGKFQGLSLLLLIMMFFVSCGDGERQARRMQEEQLKEAKKDTEVSIKQIRNDIEERIKYVDEEIEKASGELKEELEKARSELKEQKSKLNEELIKVRQASLETWSDVLAHAREIVRKTQEKRNEISKKVRELLDDN